MKIEINNHRKLFAVQEEFNLCFPSLKIEFYGKPNTTGGASSENILKSNNKTLGQCRVINRSGFITILPVMTVGELQQNFGDVYGLTIQVFQKQYNHTWHELPTGSKVTLQELKNNFELQAESIAEAFGQ